MTVSNARTVAGDLFVSNMPNADSNVSTRHSFSMGPTLEFVSARAWDNIVCQFADVIPEQMGSFNAGHWGEENLEFVAVRNEDELIGGAAVIVKAIPFANTGIAILKWGPLSQPVGMEFDAERYASIVTCLKNEYCGKRNFHLTIMPSARPAVAEQCETLLADLGFATGNRLAAPQRYIIDVDQNSEMLKASLDQKWRYNMRKAFKNDFEIRIVDARDGLKDFMNLYSQMIERKNFLDASAIGALEQMVAETPERSRPMIVMVSHGGEVTAGGVFHVIGNMASYMFGATDERALRLKAGYALHWWVAEYLCDQRAIRWYDLGGDDLDKGLHQFKKGFVGKSGHILTAPPRYHFASSISASLAGFAAFQVRDAMSSVKRRLHSLKRQR